MYRSKKKNVIIKKTKVTKCPNCGYSVEKSEYFIVSEKTIVQKIFKIFKKKKKIHQIATTYGCHYCGKIFEEVEN